MERTKLDWLEREREKLQVRLKDCETPEIKARLKKELASIAAKILSIDPVAQQVATRHRRMQNEMSNRKL